MTLSGLIMRAQSALEMFGDLECYLDVDGEEVLYGLGDVVGEDVNGQIEHVLLTAFETRHKLTVVK